MANHPFNDNDGKVTKPEDLSEEAVAVDQKIVPSGKARVVLSASLVNFTIDSAKLKKAHRDFLADELAPMLKRNTRFICQIVGVASNDKAGEAYNHLKGRQRAGEVHGFLSVVQHVPDAQLAIDETGQVRGKFGVQEDENRAVEITVFEPLSQQISIRLVDALEVWSRLGLKATNNMDQVAFLVRDKVNNNAAVHFFAEDRPQEMEKVVIIAHELSDQQGELSVNVGQPVSPVDFAGALVFLFAPDATPGRTTTLSTRFSNTRIGEIVANLPVQGVEWPIGLKSTTGHLVRAIKGETPRTPAVQSPRLLLNRGVASRR